jgi:hypothetical protein
VKNCGLDACGSGQGPMVGSCEHGNNTYDFIKGRGFIE